MREEEIKDLIRDLRLEQEDGQDQDQPEAQPTDQDQPEAQPTDTEDKSSDLDDLISRLEQVLNRLDRLLGDDDTDKEDDTDVVEYRQIPSHINAREAYNKSRYYRSRH